MPESELDNTEQLTKEEQLARLSEELAALKAQNEKDAAERHAWWDAQNARLDAAEAARIKRDMERTREAAVEQSVADLAAAERAVEQLDPTDSSTAGFEKRLVTEQGRTSARLVVLRKALAEAEAVADAALRPDRYALIAQGKTAPTFAELKAAKEKVTKYQNMIADEENATLLRLQMARADGLRRAESKERADRERAERIARANAEQAESDRLLAPARRARYLSGRG